VSNIDHGGWTGQTFEQTAPIRSLTLEDLPSCIRLAESRDWGPEQHKWRLLFEIGEVYGVDAPEGGLAGTVVSTRYGTQVAAIGMMLVAEGHERRGLGGRLMRHALERAGTAGAWLTATPFGRPLYERLGFRAIGEMSAYLGAFAPAAGGPPPPVSRRATEADLPSIRALDLAVFGAPRPELLDRLMTFSSHLRVVEGPSGITGFGGAWLNGDTTVLGPVTADDSETALMLISDLAASADGPLRLDVDHRRPELIAWAEANGLSRGFTTTIMVQGADLPGDRDRLFTPVMVALG
jgi:GNAT superfamily N-acetyltransferase